MKKATGLWHQCALKSIWYCKCTDVFFISKTIACFFVYFFNHKRGGCGMWRCAGTFARSGIRLKPDCFVFYSGFGLCSSFRIFSLATNHPKIFKESYANKLFISEYILSVSFPVFNDTTKSRSLYRIVKYNSD